MSSSSPLPPEQARADFLLSSWASLVEGQGEVSSRERAVLAFARTMFDNLVKEPEQSDVILGVEPGEPVAVDLAVLRVFSTPEHTHIGQSGEMFPSHLFDSFDAYSHDVNTDEVVRLRSGLRDLFHAAFTPEVCWERDEMPHIVLDRAGAALLGDDVVQGLRGEENLVALKASLEHARSLSGSEAMDQEVREIRDTELVRVQQDDGWTHLKGFCEATMLNFQMSLEDERLVLELRERTNPAFSSQWLRSQDLLDEAWWAVDGNTVSLSHPQQGLVVPTPETIRRALSSGVFQDSLSIEESHKSLHALEAVMSLCENERAMCRLEVTNKALEETRLHSGNPHQMQTGGLPSVEGLSQTLSDAYVDILSKAAGVEPAPGFSLTSSGKQVHSALILEANGLGVSGGDLDRVGERWSDFSDQVFGRDLDEDTHDPVVSLPCESKEGKIRAYPACRFVSPRDALRLSVLDEMVHQDLPFLIHNQQRETQNAIAKDLNLAQVDRSSVDDLRSRFRGHMAERANVVVKGVTSPSDMANVKKHIHVISKLAHHQSDPVKALRLEREAWNGFLNASCDHVHDARSVQSWRSMKESIIAVSQVDQATTQTKVVAVDFAARHKSTKKDKDQR